MNAGLASIPLLALVERDSRHLNKKLVDAVPIPHRITRTISMKNSLDATLQFGHHDKLTQGIRRRPLRELTDAQTNRLDRACDRIPDLAGRPQAQEAPRYAGATETGFLLPNGWVVSPAGEQVPVPDLPLNILPLPDSRHVLVATSGYNAHELALINLESKRWSIARPSGKPGSGWRPRPTSIGSGGRGAAGMSSTGSGSRAPS